MIPIVDIVVLAQLEGVNPEEVATAFKFLDFGKLVQVVLIMVVAYAVSRATTAFLDKLGEGQARRRMLLKQLSSFLRLGIFAVGGYAVIVTLFAEHQAALVGIGGTLAVAFGFAFKDAASSVMAGVLILIDRPFQVGDRVQFGDTYGEVKEIGLRTVRIVTLDDNEVSIPNNKFLTESVASGNSGALDMMIVMKFYVAVTEDFELAKRIVYQACITSKYVYLKKPVTMVIREEVTGVAFATVLTCKAYVIDVRYESAFATDVTERVKRAFRKHHITYPYAREYSVRRTDWEEMAEDARPVELGTDSLTVRD